MNIAALIAHRVSPANVEIAILARIFEDLRFATSINAGVTLYE